MENNTQMTTQATVETPDVGAIGLEISVPTTKNDVIPLNYEQALATYSEQERQEILELADSIDVRKTENVMSYGSIAMKRTFEQCKAFLKEEKGSQADQIVIARVIELSKKAANAHEDFNMILQEPNLFQKFLLKLASGSKGKSKTEELQKSAVTSFKFFAELATSYDSWISILKGAMADITDAAMSDLENVSWLEKYIIAGKIAEERIVNEMQAIQEQYQTTGRLQYAHSYQEFKEGHDIFEIVMNRLEDSRAMYYLSMGQLALSKKGNIYLQVAINTKGKNSIALVGQQLRNALLDAKNKEVLEGQNAIVRLNDELIKDVSQAVGMTAEQAKEAMYASFYNMDAAKTAFTTVINFGGSIQKDFDEMRTKMKENIAELNGLVEQLEPVVGTSIETLNTETSKTPTGVAGLKF